MTGDAESTAKKRPGAGITRATVDPANSTSSLSFRVRFCETDLMGIVHHGNYFQYFEMGRVEWLRRRGVTYAAWASEGTHLPVVDAQARYRKPCRFDDCLVLDTTLGELRSHSLRFDYRLTRPADGALIAEGSTRLACIDGAHRLVAFTDSMVDTLLSAELPQEKSTEADANA